MYWLHSSGGGTSDHDLLYSTVQHCTVQHCAAQRREAQSYPWCPILFRPSVYSTPLYQHFEALKYYHPNLFLHPVVSPMSLRRIRPTVLIRPRWPRSRPIPDDLRQSGEIARLDGRPAVSDDGRFRLAHPQIGGPLDHLVDLFEGRKEG